MVDFFNNWPTFVLTFLLSSHCWGLGLRTKNPLLPLPHYKMFKVMINFASHYMVSKAHGWVRDKYKVPYK